MNIFLDSNAFYKDPFLTKGKNHILLKLAGIEDVKLYINKTVYEELYRAHKNLLKKEIGMINESYTRISPFLQNEKQQLIAESIDELMSDFKSRFKVFHENDALEIIDYDADVLEHIVKIDMDKVAPFMLEDKKSIRDAIIWYSYMVFIKKNELEDCYFISNNHKEFGAEGSKKISGKPYPLHPNIVEDMNLTAYKNIYDFITHKDDEIKDLYEQLISDKLLDSIKEELEEGLLQEIMADYFVYEIVNQTDDYISNLDVERIHSDFFIGGYASPSDGEIKRISLQDVEVYGNDITVSVNIEIECSAEIYLYNPGHDDRRDKFEYCTTDILRVEENAVFIIHFDTDKIIDMENFSLKEYIEGNEPCNLDIEFIHMENIEHEDMYHEEDYIYEFE
ncbi:PIN domain-containing protein [Lysinibacillus xylanilyticus]|uniref:PIN domain-containing protein n=1 Tax=Lysinibacillus xylanilyticus TaxID=582475 RepID=UPI0037FE1454